MLVRLTALAVTAGLALAAPAAHAAFAWTGWEPLTGTQDACLDAGAQEIGKLGFRVDIPADRQTVFGWRGEDLLSIRCIADRRVAVMFVYVRSSNEEGRQLLNSLRRAYRSDAPPPGAVAPAPGIEEGGTK